MRGAGAATHRWSGRDEWSESTRARTRGKKSSQATQPSLPRIDSTHRRPRTPVESQILRHATVLQQLPLRQPPKRRLATPLPRTTDYRHLPKKPHPRGCGGAGVPCEKKPAHKCACTKDHRRRKMDTRHGRPPPDAARRLLPKNVEYTPAQGYTRRVVVRQVTGTSPCWPERWLR